MYGMPIFKECWCCGKFVNFWIVRPNEDVARCSDCAMVCEEGPCSVERNRAQELQAEMPL